MPSLSTFSRMTFIFCSLLTLCFAIYYVQFTGTGMGQYSRAGLVQLPLALSTYFGLVQAESQTPFSPPSSLDSSSSENGDHTSETTRCEWRDTLPEDVLKPFVRTIVAVGDLHGDIENAQKVLRMAHVVDDENNWSGEVDIFVQTGDVIDRGDDTIELFTWFDILREQALAVGGTVLTHLGNHEWMNVIGDWRYVHASEIKTFGSAAARQEAIATGWLGRAWAANYTTVSRLPLHPSLGPPNTDYPSTVSDPCSSATRGPLSHAAFSFVHGGLAPTYPNLSPFPGAINTISASLLRKLQSRVPQPLPHPPNPYPGLPASATREEIRLYGADGPLWYRGWANDKESVVCAQVDDVLRKTGTRRMIMGHTPDFDKIVSRCDGKIIIIDTGISHAYGGALSALSINYTLVPTSKGGWKETEVVKALYVEDEELLVLHERALSGPLW